MVKYADAGVDRGEWAHTGGFDIVDRKLAMTSQNMGGEIMPGLTHTARDFWLAEHCDRIMSTVSGLAFTGLTVTIPDASCVDARGHARHPMYYKREQFNGTVERAKEIGERFVYLTLALQPFTLEYYEGMPEADLRAWAAGVVSALQE